MARRRRLSEIHPLFFHLRVGQLRLKRKLQDSLSRDKFAGQQQSVPFSFTVKKHQSLLRRRLGDSDPELQENKIVNLSIAIPNIHGLRIAPGETFSLWRRLGPPRANRGYIEGLQLSRGEVVRGVGGGLCQLANLLYWMALHSPLEVVERHHHSFDPFPDEQRVLPFGSGAGIFYNYVDLRFSNPTDTAFCLEVWLTERHIKGRLSSEHEWPLSYKILERNHRYFKQDGICFRSNELWRKVIDRRTGDLSREELVMKNCAVVKYPVAEHLLENPHERGSCPPRSAPSASTKSQGDRQGVRRPKV